MCVGGGDVVDDERSEVKMVCAMMRDFLSKVVLRFDGCCWGLVLLGNLKDYYL